jgi:hypothetical protein
MAAFAIGPSEVRIGGYGGSLPREETAWIYRLTPSSPSGS